MDRLRVFVIALICIVAACLAALVASATATADTVEGGSEWTRITHHDSGSQWT